MNDSFSNWSTISKEQVTQQITSILYTHYLRDWTIQQDLNRLIEFCCLSIWEKHKRGKIICNEGPDLQDYIKFMSHINKEEFKLEILISRNT